MKLILVEQSSITELADFAYDVFVDYYNDLIGHKQATYMANKFLSIDAIRKLMEESAIFKIVKKDNQIVGFIEYIKEDNKLFLSKLYVEKNNRGLGIGKLMFNDCLEYAKINNLNTIYLTVNKYNMPSINIYKNLGFKIVDAVVSDIGNNYVMDDYIMEYQVV